MIKNKPELEEAFVVFITGSKVKSEDQAKGMEMGAGRLHNPPHPHRELLARVVSFERIKQTEKELRLAREELETLDTFSYTVPTRICRILPMPVSHDLQEPLHMISSFLSLLDKKYHQELDDAAHELLILLWMGRTG